VKARSENINLEDNPEQRDDDQAQDVANDAMNIDDSFEESEHGGEPNPAGIIPDDVPDLIDKMNKMISTGQIDNGAFSGEPEHDDEDKIYGNTDKDGTEE